MNPVVGGLSELAEKSDNPSVNSSAPVKGLFLRQPRGISAKKGLTKAGSTSQKNPMGLPITNPLEDIPPGLQGQNMQAFLKKMLSQRMTPGLGQMLVLLLPSLPLLVHNLQFDVRIPRLVYDILDIEPNRRNGGKKFKEYLRVEDADYYERSGSPYAKVTFMVYGDKAVISVKNNDFPHYLNSREHFEEHLMPFLQQLRQLLVHKAQASEDIENVVPQVNEWIVTRCDLNKDIRLDGRFQYQGKIAFRAFGLYLKAYIKYMHDADYLRFELRYRPKRSLREYVADVLHPNETLRRRNSDLEEQLQGLDRELGGQARVHRIQLKYWMNRYRNMEAKCRVLQAAARDSAEHKAIDTETD